MPWMPLIPMLVIAAPWQLVGVLLKVAGGRPFRKIPAEKKARDRVQSRLLNQQQCGYEEGRNDGRDEISETGEAIIEEQIAYQ